MNTIKYFFIINFIALFVTPVMAETTTATTTTTTTTNVAKNETATSSFVGEYVCKGHDPIHNNDYTNNLTITSTGSTYTYQYANDNGYPIEYGTGVANNGLPDSMAIAIWDAKDNDKKGILLYKRNADGTLEGQWTMRMETKIGTETCTKKK